MVFALLKCVKTEKFKPMWNLIMHWNLKFQVSKKVYSQASFISEFPFSSDISLKAKLQTDFKSMIYPVKHSLIQMTYLVF